VARAVRRAGRSAPAPDGHRRVAVVPALGGRAIIRASVGARPGACVATPSRAPTEGTPIDIIFLVERLESIIANGKRLPLTNNVVVDQAAALGLIDELRVAVPEEVRAAKRINSEGERILEKAQEEAERIVARAQEQAAFLIDERGLTQQAEAESRRIIAEAETDAEEVRRGADEYAVSVLVGLEGDVVKTLQSIKKGIDLLDSRRAQLRAGEEDGVGEDDEDLGDEAFEDVADDEDVAQPVRR
jgi:F0F1-type ATP synthase membrane subunit b/b'